MLYADNADNLQHVSGKKGMPAKACFFLLNVDRARVSLFRIFPYKIAEVFLDAKKLIHEARGLPLATGTRRSNESLREATTWSAGIRSSNSSVQRVSVIRWHTRDSKTHTERPFTVAGEVSQTGNTRNDILRNGF